MIKTDLYWKSYEEKNIFTDCSIYLIKRHFNYLDNLFLHFLFQQVLDDVTYKEG